LPDAAETPRARAPERGAPLGCAVPFERAVPFEPAGPSERAVPFERAAPFEPAVPFERAGGFSATACRIPTPDATPRSGVPGRRRCDRRPALRRMSAGRPAPMQADSGAPSA